MPLLRKRASIALPPANRNELTLSQTSPGFYMSALELFLKILWEKEKLLVTSNFSFSNSVFFPFGELSVTFITVKIVVCKSLLVGMSLKFVVWERVKEEFREMLALDE